MSVFNNFSVSIGTGLRRLRDSDLTGMADKLTKTTTRKGSSAHRLKMDKCLIVSKVTRYEYEKHSHDNISDSELEKVLRKRGSDFDTMFANYNIQKAFEQRVVDTLKDMGKQVEMASRMTYSDELINWCDVVVPCGGDGTYLLAASRVRNNRKPVIGFNSAPKTSVGRLCLPTWCSSDIKGALNALNEGRFKWMHRSRIRTTVVAEPDVLDEVTPNDLHTLQFRRYPPVRDDAEERILDVTRTRAESSTLGTKVLPFLALNEVFIGETVTSRVSLLRLKIDSNEWTQTKGSGLCVTTGTGSTSWFYSINCLRTISVLDVMKILANDLNLDVDTRPETVRKVTELYNKRLIFPPETKQMAYSVREYITSEEWPLGLRPRDKASMVRVQSHCTDAALVIDGSVSFPCNDGTEAVLEVHPEDALMTVQMDKV